MDKKVHRYCRFNGCKSNSNSKDVRLYRFPAQEQRCQAWVEACKNKDIINIPASALYKRAYLCTAHFEDWCFTNVNTKHRLVHNAVPNSSKLDAEELTTSKVVTEVDLNNCNSSSICLSDKSPVQASISCSTPQTRNSERKYTPRKSKLAYEVKKCRNVIRKLQTKCASYKRQINSKTAQSLKKMLIKKGVSNKLSTFIQRQVTLNTKKAKSKRFTEVEKIDAYRIYSKSRAAYRVLREYLELPSERTLQRFLSSKLSSAGISADIMDGLKQVLENKDHHEKMFALIFDEISLKPCLIYDKITDQVVGFEDFSGGFRSNLIANHALVLMLRSLTSKKKLPLGFYFSSYAMDANRLKDIVLGALAQISQAGATVKVLICDQGGNNSKLFRMLKITDLDPFFFFNDEKVYGMFDPPHLIKSLRRNLMKYDLETDKGLVSFNHIRKFYAVDQTLLVRCAPKLTDTHILTSGMNSMKVSTASQVFSHTVAAGMNLCILSNLIPASAAPTVEFIQRINNLFDSMNGTKKYPLRGKEFHCAAKKDSPHIKFWNEMLCFINSWSFINPEDNSKSKKRKKSTPQNKKGWMLSIRALLQLTEEMLQIKEFFMTKRCNQDCLENFFCRIRGSGGHRTNPSAFEFSTTFKFASMNSFSAKSKFSNCEPDGDKFMFYVLSSRSIKENKAENQEQANEIYDDFEDSLIIDTTNDHTLDETSFEAADILTKNVIAYLSGYTSRKVLRVLKIDDCNSCQMLLTDKTKPMLEHTLFLHFKEYEDNNTIGGLIHPTVNMTKCIAALLETSETFLNCHLSTPNILSHLKKLLLESPMLHFINCEVHAKDVVEKIGNVSSYLFLKIHLREKNREISKNIFDIRKVRMSKKI